MEKVKLSDLGTIITGNTPNKKNNEFYNSKDICFFKPGDITEDTIENLTSSEEHISEKARSKARILPKGTILVTCIGTIGKVGIINHEAACNQQINAIISNDKVDAKYLAYLIYRKKIFLQKKANAPVVPIINKKDFSNIEVNICNKEQQIKIVTKLDKIQEIIDIRKKQIEELDKLIKSQFVEMFGDPKSNDKNWIKEPMGDYMTVLTDFSSNGSYKTLDSKVVMYDEPKYAYMVRTTDLENDDYKNNVKYITEEAYNFLSKSKVYPDDIIMNKIGSAGKVYIMPDVGMPVSLGRNAFLFRYSDDIVPLFIYYLLKSEYGTNEISQYVRGAVTKTITKDDARKVKIIVPPIELQNQFADIVKKIDKQKFEIQKNLEEMQKLQESLMNKYFG